MTETITAPDGTKFPRKYSWPLRIFLVIFVIDMFGRSLLSLTPYDDWMDEFEMDRRPLALPTSQERKMIQEGSHPDGYSSYGERFAASIAAIGPYFSPVPSSEVRSHLETKEDYGKYAVVWLTTRMTFIGTLFGVDQDWPMFSPNVGDEDTVTRVRMVYEDGEVIEKKLLMEPDNIVSYGRWAFYRERVLASQTAVTNDADSRMGLSNVLLHRYPTNAAGSPLKKIEFYNINYHYPTPDQDPMEIMGPQMKPTPDMVEPVFWIYDAETRTGDWVEDEE